MSAAARRMMRAVRFNGAGGVDVISLGSIERPKPTTGQVLVRVAATAVNRGDIAQRKGHYPPPAGVSDVPGLEFAGTVVDIDESLENSPGHAPEVGSRVMGIIRGGGYGEYVTVPASLCIPVPPNMTLAEAAALPETYMTAFQAIHHHGGMLPDAAGAAQYAQGLKVRPPADQLGRNYRILVHAGASGVGISACHIAKLFDIDTITTSSEGKVEACKKWATHALSRTPNAEGVVFRDKVEQTVGKNAIDLIIDPVFGGNYLQEGGDVLAMDGSLVVLSFLGGSKVPELKGNSFFTKRANIRFSSLRSTSEFYRAGLTAAFRRRIMPAISGGKIKPVIAKTMPLEDIKEAHRLIEENAVVGKIVLVVDKRSAGV